MESKLNSEKIWKIGEKRGKRYITNMEVNGEKIVNIQMKGKKNSEKTWKTWKKGKLNSDNIQKYERNVVGQWRDLEI